MSPREEPIQGTMNRVLVRSIDIVQELRNAFAEVPSCRIVEDGGRVFAIFRSPVEKAVIDITALARQIGERIS